MSGHIHTLLYQTLSCFVIHGVPYHAIVQTVKARGNQNNTTMGPPVLGSLLFKTNSLHITLYFEESLYITVTYYLEIKVTII